MFRISFVLCSKFLKYYCAGGFIYLSLYRNPFVWGLCMCNSTTEDMCRVNVSSRKGILMAAFAAALILVSPGADAQRTMRNQWYATAEYRHDISAGDVYMHGFGVSFGQYLMDMYWQAGASRVNRLGDTHRGLYLLEGGAAYRLFSLRSHILNFYVGGNVVFGYDFGERAVAVPATETEIDLTGKGTGVNFSDLISGVGSDSSYPSGFCYGITPKLEMEVFPLRKLAVVAGLDASLIALTYEEKEVTAATALPYADAAFASAVKVTKTSVSLTSGWYAGLRLNF